MTLEEVADQLRAAGLWVRVFPVSHNSQTKDGMSVVYHNEEAVLADPILALSEPTFWIDWQDDFWTLVSSFAIPISPMIRVSPDLAVIVQAIQDFHTLCYTVTPDRHQDVCDTMI